jgi:hypothetical protein
MASAHPPTRVSACCSPDGDTRTSAAMAPAHGGEAGVRMTAPAASTPVTGRPARAPALVAGRGGARFVVAKVEYQAQSGKRLVMADSGGSMTSLPELGGRAR